jgi:hypothetical protein
MPKLSRLKKALESQKLAVNNLFSIIQKCIRLPCTLGKLQLKISGKIVKTLQ